MSGVTRLSTQQSPTVQTMRETTFLVALVSYMAVVVVALVMMVNQLGA